jgi:hypothetical protein
MMYRWLIPRIDLPYLVIRRLLYCWEFSYSALQLVLGNVGLVRFRCNVIELCTFQGSVHPQLYNHCI